MANLAKNFSKQFCVFDVAFVVKNDLLLHLTGIKPISKLVSELYNLNNTKALSNHNKINVLKRRVIKNEPFHPNLTFNNFF